ncbi:hypothetical protein D0Z07_1897 [Hyphodiscus hymeniophilus]|uniref:DUF6594 domain-containing protein n=1 Tax=Hyphodiscus hymeniophilus TaxID=353542 RepID=A0A9P6VN80_9HELO|nr:hypothetical protein D0Z07_1897 [Hyphodiscus hymeniophilus]
MSMADQQGYEKVATLMNCFNEFAVFRRFGKLNFLNLLYLQAELTHLEADLKELAERDAADPHRRLYSKHWWRMTQSEEEHDDRAQWEMALRVRGKLKEYNEHLQQAVFLCGLKTAKSCDLETLRSWLEMPKGGFFPIESPDRHSWSVDHDDDLLAIRRRDSSDPLSRWIFDRFIPWFHNLIGKRFKVRSSSPTLCCHRQADQKPIASDPSSEIAHYAGAPLHSAINIFVTVLASLIPITSILILYFVSNTLDRLAIVVAFTGLFAFCLAATTRARRVEIFGATSAFAAVQVVFVTGNNGCIA